MDYLLEKREWTIRASEPGRLSLRKAWSSRATPFADSWTCHPVCAASRERGSHYGYTTVSIWYLRKWAKMSECVAWCGEMLHRPFARHRGEGWRWRTELHRSGKRSGVARKRPQIPSSGKARTTLPRRKNAVVRDGARRKALQIND